MKWVKAIIVGAIAALVMFLIMVLGIRVMDTAPINQPPSAAFLEQLGLEAAALPPIMHFTYGMLWSVILVAVLKERTNIWSGLGLGVLLWLIFMLIYSPVIGWGFFGIGGAGHDLPSDHSLYLGSSVKFIIGTLVLHLIYGGLVGWLNRLWIDFRQPPEIVKLQDRKAASGQQSDSQQQAGQDQPQASS